MSFDHSKTQRPHIIVRFIRKIIWTGRLFAQKSKHYFVKTVSWPIKRILNIPILKIYLLRRQLRKILLEFYTISVKQDSSPKNTINLALIVRDGTKYPKSSAFIRLLSPLSHSSVRDQLTISLFDENTTKLPSDTDICIIQRTAFDNVASAKLLIEETKSNHIKVVIDNDDAFSLLDNSHVEHTIQSERYEALEFLMQAADQIWVSTQKLAELFDGDTSKLRVVSNSLDLRLWRSEEHKTNTSAVTNNATKPPLQMLYMGTATHESDFNMILPALDIVAQNYPNSFTLTIIGIAAGDLPVRPWIRRLRQERGGSIYPLFVRWFLRQGPFDIGLCPLITSPFNDCKSDIKCLDYIAANILPVASNVPAYSTPELSDHIIHTNNTVPAWAHTLEALVTESSVQRITRQQAVKLSRDILFTNRETHETAQTLFDYLHRLSTK